MEKIIEFFTKNPDPREGLIIFLAFSIVIFALCIFVHKMLSHTKKSPPT